MHVAAAYIMPARPHAKTLFSQSAVVTWWCPVALNDNYVTALLAGSATPASREAPAPLQDHRQDSAPWRQAQCASSGTPGAPGRQAPGRQKLHPDARLVSSMRPQHLGTAHWMRQQDSGISDWMWDWDTGTGCRTRMRQQDSGISDWLRCRDARTGNGTRRPIVSVTVQRCCLGWAGQWKHGQDLSINHGAQYAVRLADQRKLWVAQQLTGLAAGAATPDSRSSRFFFFSARAFSRLALRALAAALALATFAALSSGTMDLRGRRSRRDAGVDGTCSRRQRAAHSRKCCF